MSERDAPRLCARTGRTPALLLCRWIKEGHMRLNKARGICRDVQTFAPLFSRKDDLGCAHIAREKAGVTLGWESLGASGLLWGQATDKVTLFSPYSLLISPRLPSVSELSRIYRPRALYFPFFALTTPHDSSHINPHYTTKK
jgi:hypothetical protein